MERVLRARVLACLRERDQRGHAWWLEIAGRRKIGGFSFQTKKVEEMEENKQERK